MHESESDSSRHCGRGAIRINTPYWTNLIIVSECWLWPGRGVNGKRKRAKGAGIRVVYELSLLNLLSGVTRISESSISYISVIKYNSCCLIPPPHLLRLCPLPLRIHLLPPCLLPVILMALRKLGLLCGNDDTSHSKKVWILKSHPKESLSK